MIIKLIQVFLLFLLWRESEFAEISTLHVISEVQARFAITDVLSIIENNTPYPEEIPFFAQLPNNAFISNFSMDINGELVVGDVREKQRARAAYEAAKRQGKSAGLVSDDPRETNSFLITVNSGPYTKITFVLTYQEVLNRAHGVYKHIVNIQPAGPVKDMQVDVLISEKRKITMVHSPTFAPRIGEKTNRDLLQMPADPRIEVRSHDETQGGSLAYVSFNPTKNNNGRPQQVNGQMVVLYDVERRFDGGEIEIVNGYFVHFVAPAGLDPVPKHVVFVIDRSGSMQGRKMQQTKAAMTKILRDLQYQDHFNIITFSNDVRTWAPQSVTATPENRARAEQFVNQMYAQGGTNIHSALQEGMRLLSQDRTNPMSLLVFLTDGQPTVGVTDMNRISGDMSRMNNQFGATMHGIAFGNDADYKLMQILAANNGGIARKIYEDSDATLQITGFIDEIANPYLSQVQIRYVDQSVDTGSLIEQGTNTLYEGGEGVVVGKLNGFGGGNSIQATVSGRGKTGPVRLHAQADPSRDGNTIGCISAPSTWTGMPQPRHRPIVCPGLTPSREQPQWSTQRRQFQPQVEEFRPQGPTPPPLSPLTVGGFLEHMWAYMTIKQLLKDSKYSAKSRQEAAQKRQKALDMSLKYNFVTELTSMVVIPPNNNGRPTQLFGRNELPQRTGGIPRGPQGEEMRLGENGQPRPKPAGAAPQAAFVTPPSVNAVDSSSGCEIDILMIIDNGVGRAGLSQIRSFATNLVSDIKKKTDTKTRIAVASLNGQTREGKSLHIFSESQFPVSIIRKIMSMGRSRRGRTSRNRFDSQINTLKEKNGKKKIVMFIGGSNSPGLGNFGATLQGLRQAGVKLFGVAPTSTFGNRLAFNLKTLAGSSDYVMERQKVSEVSKAIKC